jgi:Amidases related to nicotinamidase
MAEARALIIVDVQPTFCEGGALGVEGGNATAERIADFVTENAEEYAMLVTTQDWHIDPGSHFSETPDFIDTWPPHALAGSAEAELHEAVASLPIDASVKKGEYEAAYSGFEGRDAGDRPLEEILRNAGIEEVDVVGIAESHCVKETALDALKAGFPTRVLSDLTVPVSEELGIAARTEMDEAGVEQIDSPHAFGFYDETADTSIPGDDYATVEEEIASYEGHDRRGYGNLDGDAHIDPSSGNPGADATGNYGDLDEAESEPEDLAARLTAGLGIGAGLIQTTEADDIDLDDFDVEIDDEIDFSADAEESDFDFSDINYKPDV